jgi:hypothetical protein
MRDSQTGTLTWLGTSAQGSMAVSQANGTTTFAVQRYTPYGESRGTPDALGQIQRWMHGRVMVGEW